MRSATAITAAVLVAAAAAAEGCSSSSSGSTSASPAASASSAAASPSTGALVLNGSTTNMASNATVPLTVTAPGISTTGTLPAGNGTKGTIKTGEGDITVTHTNPPATQPKVDTATCSASEAFAGTFTIDSGTGKFTGATGHGAYTIRVTAKFALTGGKCQITASSSPTSGLETFHATGPITIAG